MPKIAITGKGGAGKTMLSSTIAFIRSSQGDSVYAIDADPNPTLGQALGIPLDLLKSISPVRTLNDLIKERTGSNAESYANYFSLNPTVDDIPGKYSLVYRSIKLLVMGATRGVNTGCACAENSFVKALVNHLILRSSETVIMDMVAGTEHLGRGTATGVDAMIVVVEPSMRSVQAALSVVAMVANLKKLNYYIVGNKIRSNSDQLFLENWFSKEKIAGYLSWNTEIIEAENRGVPVYDAVPETINQIKTVLGNITI